MGLKLLTDSYFDEAYISGALPVDGEIGHRLLAPAVPMRMLLMAGKVLCKQAPWCRLLVMVDHSTFQTAQVNDASLQVQRKQAWCVLFR